MIIAETYDVERLLGKGGMGEVWLARHLRLAGKQVAIKVLHTLEASPNPELLARFRREAEIAARLDHPSIVQVLDFNQLPTGEPYLVMEFLKGESLADRLRARGGSIPASQVQAIVLQVGSALQAAHAAGVVHRDLKPDNIFLVPTALGDQIKVLDFGISKLSQAGTLQTTEQTLLGTPLYMSPEQALGQNRDTTAQSDLFSLGSICYELLTGSAPFVAESIAQVVFRIAYQPHVSLDQMKPGLPPNVVGAVEHALIKDRASRTIDIVTFIRELTGEELATVAPHEPSEVSGVYSPGMKVSDSLLMNATVAPSVRLSKATPKRASSRRVNLSEPKTEPELARTAPAARSPLPLVAGGLVLVAVVAGGTFLALRSQGTGPGRAGAMRFDAGPAAVAVAVVAAKVEAVPTAVDAGLMAVESLDAGAKSPRPVKMAEAPLSADDLAVLNPLRAFKRDKAWERLALIRMNAFNNCKSDGCRREVLLLAIEAVCTTKDLSAATGLYRRFEDRDVEARGRAKQLCRRYFPDWDP